MAETIKLRDKRQRDLWERVFTTWLDNGAFPDAARKLADRALDEWRTRMGEPAEEVAVDEASSPRFDENILERLASVANEQIEQPMRDLLLEARRQIKTARWYVTSLANELKSAQEQKGGA